MAHIYTRARERRRPKRNVVKYRLTSLALWCDLRVARETLRARIPSPSRRIALLPIRASAYTPRFPRESKVRNLRGSGYRNYRRRPRREDY